MDDAQLAVKNWDSKSSRPAAFAVRITGFNKYWGIFGSGDGSKFFWFGSTNTIAEKWILILYFLMANYGLTMDGQKLPHCLLTKITWRC